MFEKRILVPQYFDTRWIMDFKALVDQEKLESVSLGELEDEGILQIMSGHGSPSNDRRSGHIPYVKVSDLRSLRININPTNLVSEVVAKKYWGGAASGLKAWDLISPNRASSNIGEFSVLLPGEEQIVITREVFVFRIAENAPDVWTPFYLHWCLCLKAVRQQWRRVTLMQTNREDVGNRYREILIPLPKDKEWAEGVSLPFKSHFTTIANSRTEFLESLSGTQFTYIASATSLVPDDVEEGDVDSEL